MYFLCLNYLIKARKYKKIDHWINSSHAWKRKRLHRITVQRNCGFSSSKPAAIVSLKMMYGGSSSLPIKLLSPLLPSWTLWKKKTSEYNRMIKENVFVIIERWTMARCDTSQQRWQAVLLLSSDGKLCYLSAAMASCATYQQRWQAVLLLNSDGKLCYLSAAMNVWR